MQTVLVIDDDTALRDTIGLMLETEGFRPALAEDGETGIKQAMALKPDLVLVDLRMPGLSGIEVCKQIRAAGMKTPLIVLSAIGDEMDKVLLLEIGADDYVVKPFGTPGGRYRVDRDVVRSLKESTGGSDFCFLSGGATGTVVASTLDAGASASVQAAHSLAGASGTVERIEASGTPYTMLGTPLLDVAGKPIGELRILRSSESAQQRINALRRNIFIVWLIAVLVGLWLTYSLARRILKPVGELDRGAGEVSRGNYDYRIPQEDPDVGTRDELGRLAAAFNAMCASIQGGRQELIRQERIATIGRLSTSIVHDLRNPLAAIYGGAEMLIDGELSTGQVQRLAGNIYRSSRRMQQLLQDLVDAGRGRSSSAEMCRLKDIVAAACDVFSSTAEAQSVAIETDVPEDIELPLERARIERVFLNLIDNALGMMPKGGRLRITAKTNGSSVVVRVQDNGPGIPEQIRSRLFQPFVTAGKKNGVGLDLAFSHQTILDHGGKLWADPETTEGACFLIQLPFSVTAAD